MTQLSLWPSTRERITRRERPIGPSELTQSELAPFVTPTVAMMYGRVADLRAQYCGDFPGGGLIIPRLVPVGVGRRVFVDLTFASDRIAVQCDGIVRAKHSGATARTTIELVGAGRPLGELLGACAPAEPVQLAARLRRFRVELPVELGLRDGRRQVGSTIDICKSGLGVRIFDPPPVGEIVTATLGASRRAATHARFAVMRHGTCGATCGLAPVDVGPRDHQRFAVLYSRICLTATL